MEAIRPRQISEFIEIFWRRKRLFLLMSAAMLIATIFVARRIPNQYQSSALLVISDKINDDTSPHTIQLAELEKQMTSRANLMQIIRRHGLYPQIKDTEAAVGAMTKAIKTETKLRPYSPFNPETISISFRYGDAALTQRVTADLLNTYEQANISARQAAGDEAGRLTGKIAEVEARLKEIGPQRDLTLLRAEAMARSAREDVSNRTQRVAVESSVESLSDKEYLLERQIAEQKRQIAEQERAVKLSGASSGATASAAYGQLLIRKSELEAQIKDASQQFTEKHPKMIQLRSQQQEIDRQISRLESGTDTVSGAATLSPEVRELRVMQREVTRLEGELEITRRELNRKNTVLGKLAQSTDQSDSKDQPLSSAGSDSQNEYNRLISRYNWLLDKQEMLLKLSGGGTASLMPFQIIDPPVLPRDPVAPNRLLLQGVALGLALAFGLLVTFATELPRLFLLNDERDIQFYLGAPVLAAIPETLTSTERARTRKLSLTRAMLVLVLAIILVPILIAVFKVVPVFQMLGNK